MYRCDSYSTNNSLDEGEDEGIRITASASTSSSLDLTDSANDHHAQIPASDSLTSLQQMLTTIQNERNKDVGPKMITGGSDEGFIWVARDSFWTNLFLSHFLEAPDQEHRDDMVFYVKKSSSKSKYNLPQSEIEVYRKSSKHHPMLTEVTVDWEETVYLNLIMHQFEYFVTCAVCTRTGDKELQILNKFTQRVYASPSRRDMENKGTKEEITYPNIFFTVDNFEEAFSDIIVKDSEMVCVELVAKDRQGKFQGVIFLGSIKYDALKTVYDTRASISTRMASRMGFSNSHERVEYVRMRGPKGKGHAEMAVSRLKGSGLEASSEQIASTEGAHANDWEVEETNEEIPYSRRRMSDPSSSWQVFLRGSFKTKGVRKSRSETECVDHLGANGCQEVEARNLEDEFDENVDHYHGFFGKSFGQAWHWFKENKRARSIALNAYLTYITLPWHRIIADVLEARQEPVLSALSNPVT